MSKLWGGRFSGGTAEELELFSESISFDKRLYLEDIEGSIAHADMLKSIGILSEDENNKINRGLNVIKEEIETGKFNYDIKLEDIHMSIESRLIYLIGDIGKKLHTARSRNDQVALDTRMYVLKEIKNLKNLLKNIRLRLVEISENNTETIMPGYTHMQRAQVVSLAHHFMAYYNMFKRDYGRLADLEERILMEMPLGSGAIAGTTLRIDRQMVADKLGFKAVSTNSMDSVSDRDYVIEFNSDCAIIMLHLSRLSEEMILWNTQEFSFIRIADAYATGSSMMPQKKNPDIPELIRGKSARVVGNLMQIITLVKGTPLTYNRDFQEDKESLFDTIDQTKACISIMTSFLNNISFNRQKMYEATLSGFLNATEAMEFFITKNIPNRDAHHIIGSAVAYCVKNSKLLEELTLDEWCKISDKLVGLIDNDISEILSVKNCLQARNSYGGPCPYMVKEVIINAKEELNSL